MTMLDILWILTLTVCEPSGCVSQTIEEFREKDHCLIQQWEHEALPQDNPRWTSIAYACTVKGGLQAGLPEMGATAKKIAA